ncbi:hypothetical protein DSM101010T_08750 [Desulfovibrio subterraneus]|uniref:Uncharacterized protein n=1 Tax=Desulfovibrio subterraneus TaxID=2718620 RepID=A0A7J0BFP9_9BACT|nr:hypothetical protein DSM101010T_08750 [Desulfovibrio subterraneus]
MQATFARWRAARDCADYLGCRKELDGTELHRTGLQGLPELRLIHIYTHFSEDGGIAAARAGLQARLFIRKEPRYRLANQRGHVTAIGISQGMQLISDFLRNGY